MQHRVLERYPDAHLHVYAIWTDKRVFDSRSKWDGADLADRRVMHLWDDVDLSGRWLVEHVPGFDGNDWDTYALFGPDARWDGTLSPPLSSGSTIIRSSDRLAAAIAPLLGSSP